MTEINWVWIGCCTVWFICRHFGDYGLKINVAGGQLNGNVCSVSRFSEVVVIVGYKR